MSRTKKTILAASALVVISLSTVVVVVASRRQRPDHAWDPKVDRPTYTQRHPRVVIDRAHYNSHTADDKYLPFARLRRADGYQVGNGDHPFNSAGLAGVNVLVTVNPAGGPRYQVLGLNLPIPTKKTRDMRAFTPEEIEGVRAWVEQGGSLLLISDHAPFGTAAKALAAAFGVTMHEGFVEDPKGEKGPAGSMIFSNENGLLGDHPIISGDGPNAGVKKVMTFTGQSLDGPPEASVLLRLPESAVEYVPPGPKLKEQPAGAAQALALPWGRGTRGHSWRSRHADRANRQVKPVRDEYPWKRQSSIRIEHPALAVARPLV